MTDDLGGESPSGELIAATRVNRKAGSVSDSLKEAESETCGATYRNRISGGGVGASGPLTAKLLRSSDVHVNPALVQG
jgi:hypothetical protein